MPNQPILRQSCRLLAAGLVGLAVAAPSWADSSNPFSEMGSRLARPAPVQRVVGANELWGQVARLLGQPGAVSRSQFEGAFGAPMRESLIGGDSSYYAVNSGQGLFFDIGLSAYSYDGKLKTRVRTARAVDEQQACVSVATAAEDLMAQGWQPGQYDGRNGSFYSFARRANAGLDRVFLYATQGCVSRVSISMVA